MGSPGVTTDTTSGHLTKSLKRQVIGYSHTAKLPKDGSLVADYKRDENSPSHRLCDLNNKSY